jgi:hypothetical protein
MFYLITIIRRIDRLLIIHVNSLFNLDKQYNYNFGTSELSHNPILNPTNNINYNKYIRIDDNQINSAKQGYLENAAYSHVNEPAYTTGNDMGSNNEIVKNKTYEYVSNPNQQNMFHEQINNVGYDTHSYGYNQEVNGYNVPNYQPTYIYNNTLSSNNSNTQSYPHTYSHYQGYNNFQPKTGSSQSNQTGTISPNDRLRMAGNNIMN